jgi:hypothetical protein
MLETMKFEGKNRNTKKEKVVKGKRTGCEKLKL